MKRTTALLLTAAAALTLTACGTPEQDPWETCMKAAAAQQSEFEPLDVCTRILEEQGEEQFEKTFTE